jgi:hypothetical protein
VITADTITDEQIRELRAMQIEAYRIGDASQAGDLDYSFAALRSEGARLGLFTGRRISREEGRARCAEILNARRSK